jgi:hypothetical protein
MLILWVKVKGSWSDDERMLISLGFDEEVSLSPSLAASLTSILNFFSLSLTG